MALPLSGPLSISDIRNEGVAGGCYSASDPYSIGLLAAAFDIPGDPDAISEFYGLACPVIPTTTTTTTSTTTTTTTSLEPTTTTTSTTTTTTTPEPTTTTTTSTSTTTTSTSTTTTTTTLPTFPCATGVSFTGGISYPTSNNITLGSTTGTVVLEFEAYSAADLFILKYDAIVLSTGYRGSSSLNFGGVNRFAFNSSLTGKIDPIYLTTYPDITNYPQDGYPLVTSPGNGSTSFEKTTASPVTAVLSVYAPLSGTEWNATVYCPGLPPTTTTTSTTTTTTTAPFTTSSTTSTTSLPTTTTTTLLPISFIATPSCVSGSGQIAVTSYSGGNGIYEFIAIGSSKSNAISNVNTSPRFTASSSFTFTSLSDGNYWVALRDSAGNVGSTNDPGINISCATTTTSTTTTTTTAAPATVKLTECAGYGSRILSVTYSSAPIDGDVIQVNSGTFTGCFTVSYFKPGDGSDGNLSSFTSIGDCSNCTI